jgi:hypothetical protein
MMLAQDKVTSNMLWGYLGAYNSLPIVYDELTNIPIKDVSELVFSVSSGRAKERMTATGEARSNNSNWSTIMLASGNTLLGEKLQQHRANTEAEVSRLFEFTQTAKPHLNVADANALFPQFHDNYGHAGHVFARFVTKHRAKVIKALHAEQRKLIEEFGLTQVERHWSALFAAVMVALHICRANKLLAFDPAAIKAWMQLRLAENRGQRTEAITDYSELLGQMIDDLWVDVLVTDGWGDLRGTQALPLVIKHPKNAIVGRAVRAKGAEPSDLVISRFAIQRWCALKMASPTQLRNAAIDAGLVHKDITRFSVGRGTREYSTTGNVFCWRFFPDAMDAALGSSNVLSLVQGGRP